MTNHSIFHKDEFIFSSKMKGGADPDDDNNNSDKEPQTITGAITGLAQEATKGVTRIGDVVVKGAITNTSNIGEAVAKTTVATIGKYVDGAVSSLLTDDIKDKTVAELSKISIAKLEKLVEIGSQVAKDPEAQEILREVGKVFGDLIQNVMETAREPLRKASTTALDIGRDVGGETLSGATKFGVDMVSVIVAEIPVVGGIVDLFIAIGRAFNSMMKASKLGTQNSFMVVDIVNKLIAEILPKINTSVDSGIDIKHKLSGITDRIVSTLNGATKSIQSGGKKRSHKNMDIIEELFKRTLKKKKTRRYVAARTRRR